MRIMQVLLWENQRRETIIIRDDSDTIKEKFINQYIDKHVPGYHEHIEIIHHYGYRGYLWEFCKKEGRKIIGEKEAFLWIEKQGTTLFFFDNSNYMGEETVASIPDIEWTNHVYQCKGDTVCRLSKAYNLYDSRSAAYMKSNRINPFPQSFYICTPDLSQCIMLTGEYERISGKEQDRICVLYENG